MTYRERRERRAARLRGWAEKRQDRAAASFNAAHERAAGIPMGQPILVGHHSERRHRRDLERIDSGIRRGFEHQHKAEQMASHAAEIERQADRSIYSDDPDAIEQLQERVAALEAQRDRRKQINREIRRGAGWESRIAPPLTDDERADLTNAARFSGCKGYPPYSFQNLAGNISRQRERLAQLERERQTTPPPVEAEAESPDPIADFARELNPPAGALADALPFALQAETPRSAPTEHQPNLFTKATE